MGRNSIRRNNRHWVSSFGCVLFGTLPRQNPFPLGMAVFLSWSLSRLLRFSRSQPQRSLGLRCTEPGRRARSHEVCSQTSQIHRLWNGTCQGQLPPLARSFPLNPRWVRLEGTIKWTLTAVTTATDADASPGFVAPPLVAPAGTVDWFLFAFVFAFSPSFSCLSESLAFSQNEESAPGLFEPEFKCWLFGLRFWSWDCRGVGSWGSSGSFSGFSLFPL